MAASSTCQITVTGVIGPGNSLSAYVIKGVTKFQLDPINEVLTYNQGDTVNQISIGAATTITVTVSAAHGNYTVSIS